MIEFKGVRKLQYTAAGHVDCEVNHPDYGWIPFTASPDDTAEYGRLLHAEICAGKHGEIAAHVPRVPTVEEIQARRAKAYADPVTGSDRLFAEANRLALQGIDNTAKLAEAQARYDAIRAEYPIPETV